jgi:hypothetical protein
MQHIFGLQERLTSVSAVGSHSGQACTCSSAIKAAAAANIPVECKRRNELQQICIPEASIGELAEQQAANQAAAEHQQVRKHCRSPAAGEDAAEQEGEGDHVVAKQRVQDELDACMVALKHNIIG